MSASPSIDEDIAELKRLAENASGVLRGKTTVYFCDGRPIGISYDEDAPAAAESQIAASPARILRILAHVETLETALRAQLIAELRDERALGGGWFVLLAPGWQYDGAHAFGEDTKAAVWQTLRSVRPCACDECRARAMQDAPQ